MNVRLQDQTGAEVSLAAPPQRIVSLVPSLTELLFSLGLKGRVAGRTLFCIQPKGEVDEVERCGGTKNPKLSAIARMEPDLIIANKEENRQQDVDWLSRRFPVYTSNVATLEDNYQCIGHLGQLTDTVPAAQNLIKQLQEALGPLKNTFHGERVLYLIWRRPWMAPGQGTFINHVLEYLGLENAAGHLRRYPEFFSKDLQDLAPQFVFLSSEPYPFKERHLPVLQALLPNAQPLLVDGTLFSWYGSRLLLLPEYVAGLKRDIQKQEA